VDPSCRLLVAAALTLGLAGCGGSAVTSATVSSAAVATSSPAVAPLDAVTAGQFCGGDDESPIIHFRGRGTVRLAGVVLGHGTTAVLFAHQIDGDFCQWLAFAHTVARSGTSALVFSFRDMLPSTGTDDAQGFGYPADLVAAAAELRRRGARRIVLVGASIGASAAIEAARRIRAEAVVALSPPASLGDIDAAQAVAKDTMPILIVAARDDIAGDARQIARRAGPNAKLVIVPGSAHGVELLDGPQGERVRRLIAPLLAG
jgi:pimeloyl-ACP methyl ester carboxylesterase